MNTTNKILLGLAVVTVGLIFIVNSKNGTENSSEDSSSASYHESGRITTVVDGVDVKRVNLWSSTSGNRSVECIVVKGQKVKILEDADPYYRVEAIGRSGCEGYCMKGFVVKD